MPRRTRRDVLRTLGATATTVGLAGCGLSGPPCGVTEDAPQATVATETASLDALPDDATWAMAGGNPGRTRSTAAAGPVEDVALTWRADVDDHTFSDHVAVADGRLYAAGGDTLSVLDPVAEARDWEYSVSAPEPGVQRPTVARDAGVVVVGTGDGLHAVDVETAERRWRYGDETVFPAGVADGTVYALGTDDLHAVDAASGERRFAETSVGRFVGVADGRAVVTDPLRAIDAADGTELWRIGEDRAADLDVGSGLVADGTVYLVVRGPGDYRLVHAVDAADGTRLWRYESEDLDSFRAPAYADGRVVLGSFATEGGGGHLHVLDGSTGEQAWMANVDCDVHAPAVAGDVVYVVASDTLQARRLSDGELLWYHVHETPCDHENDFCEYGSPVAVDGVLLASSTSREVHVFTER